MSIFGPGWFGSRNPLRAYGGKVLRVLHPETGLPVPTVGKVVTNAEGMYDQFETVGTIDHVVLSLGNGQHQQSATRIGVALADPGTYPTKEDLQAVEAKADQALADGGTYVPKTEVGRTVETVHGAQAKADAAEAAAKAHAGTLAYGTNLEATNAVIDARTGNGQRPVGRGEDVYRPEWYGAVGNGTTDDTAALQACINAIRDAGGGTMKLTAGKTYVVVRLDVQAGLIIDGYGATFLRPPMQPNWTRTITNESRYAYNHPRKPIVIRGLTVDGNLANQGWDGGYSQEQSSLMLFSAASTDPNQQRVIIEDVTTVGSVSDGIHFVRGIDGVIRNSKGVECFRGGITLTGGNSKVLVDGYHGTGSTLGAHIEMEVDSPGYGSSKRCDLTLRNAVFDTPHPAAKPAQFHARNGSRITVEDSVMAGGLWVSGGSITDGSGVIRFRRCQISTYQATDCNAVRNPVDVEFADCIITANNPTGAATTVKGIDNIMNLLGAGPQNARLRFVDCQWRVGTTVSGDTLIAFFNNGDTTANGHEITFTGGWIGSAFTRGIQLLQGGRLNVDRLRLSATRGIHAARTTNLDYHLTIGQIRVDPSCTTYLYLENSNAACSVTHQETVMDESVNNIGTVSGITNNVYLGSRVILTSAAPTAATDGLTGDVARLKTPTAGAAYEWVCTAPSHAATTWKAKTTLPA